MTSDERKAIVWRNGRCIERVWDGWHSFPCKNPAKYGDYCGTHCPDRIEARRKNRGPTQYELDCEAAKGRRERAEADEAALDSLLQVVRGVAARLSFLGVQDGIKLDEAMKKYDTHTKG